MNESRASGSRKTAEALEAIRRQRAIPVVRASDPDTALTICARLAAAGFAVIEITATIPNWWLLPEAIRSTQPAATVGVGTITSAGEAATALQAGAQFIVSPYPADEARQLASENDTLFVGGGFTPREVAESARHGLCKLFPAHLGGPGYLRTLTSILPDAQIMPTGGIRIHEVSSWLAAGAAAVGVGSDLYSAPDIDAAVAELQEQIRRDASA
jgi:2-dehydro-3-deoxyphosphogluconate aldolase / (4S)-4-hydroxy-2-oxoglutarate aldolase